MSEDSELEEVMDDLSASPVQRTAVMDEMASASEAEEDEYAEELYSEEEYSDVCDDENGDADDNAGGVDNRDVEEVCVWTKMHVHFRMYRCMVDRFVYICEAEI